MKKAVFYLSLFLLAFTIKAEEDDGKYHPEGGEGRYVRPAGEGKYDRPLDEGKYIHVPNPYQHVDNPYEHISDPYAGGYGEYHEVGDHFGAGSDNRPTYTKAPKPTGAIPTDGFYQCYGPDTNSYKIKLTATEGPHFKAEVERVDSCNYNFIGVTSLEGCLERFQNQFCSSRTNLY